MIGLPGPRDRPLQTLWMNNRAARLNSAVIRRSAYHVAAMKIVTILQLIDDM
jgi:hypothetical protein